MRTIRTEKYAQMSGISKQSLKTKIYKTLYPISKGIFSDDSWVPVHEMFKALDGLGLEYVMTGSDYGVSPSFQQTWTGEGWKIPNDYKEWKFEIDFTNNKGKPNKLYGIIIAHGAASMESPLDKYDITFNIG
jgi:hypothetical protein